MVTHTQDIYIYILLCLLSSHQNPHFSFVCILSILFLLVCFQKAWSYGWSSITNHTTPIPTSNSTQTLPSLHLLNPHLIFHHSLPIVLSLLPQEKSHFSLLSSHDSSCFFEPPAFLSSPLGKCLIVFVDIYMCKSNWMNHLHQQMLEIWSYQQKKNRVDKLILFYFADLFVRCESRAQRQASCRFVQWRTRNKRFSVSYSCFFSIFHFCLVLEK